MNPTHLGKAAALAAAAAIILLGATTAAHDRTACAPYGEWHSSFIDANATLEEGWILGDPSTQLTFLELWRAPSGLWVVIATTPAGLAPHPNDTTCVVTKGLTS